MSFHVGMKVVCMDDVWKDPAWQVVPNKPVCGGVYTIRGFHAEKHFDGVWLDEIVNAPDKWREFPCPHEMSFPVRRFRPLITRSTETGMAILRKVANDAAKRKNLVSL